LQALSVEDLVSKFVSTIVNEDGTITFDVTDGNGYNVTVNDVEFSDVFSNDWYFEAIKYVSSLGIMNGENGVGSENFAPNTTLTRGMIAQIVYNMYATTETAQENHFNDMTTEDWWYNAANWAYENGILTGYGDTGIFGGSDNVTREQVATVLYRLAGEPELENTSIDFPDADNVSDYAKEAVAWCTQNGIITGNCGNILPGDEATRAEIATMILRFNVALA
jgi:hypothetical protein